MFLKADLDRVVRTLSEDASWRIGFELFAQVLI